jgi:hypothetical protein
MSDLAIIAGTILGLAVVGAFFSLLRSFRDPYR